MLESQVFDYFKEISAIPRGSNNEKRIADYLCSFAERNGLSYCRDASNNVLIRKDATADYHQSPTVILQGHVDMVCEKNASITHDFLRDPLDLTEKQGWISANGTTLGADDGIAVAMMLAILSAPDDSIGHPPLECLFTVGEEIGLIGASVFDYSQIRGRLLINIDSEDEGRICVGCAGGVRNDFTLVPEAVELPDNAACCSIQFGGFYGGHSGADIAKGRVNANIECFRLVKQLADRFDVSLISLCGGNMDNAIPRDCEAVIACRSEDAKDIKAIAEQFAQYNGLDQNAAVTFAIVNKEKRAMSNVYRDNLLKFVFSLPNGVIEMNQILPELVNSSANMGICRVSCDMIQITSSIRSNVDLRLEQLKRSYRNLAEQYGFQCKSRGAYPAWEFCPSSRLLELCKSTFSELYGYQPIVETIHAGLECGIFSHNLPGLEAISMGPDIENIHTPAERVNIDSIKRVFAHILLMLSKLK